jgi:hypothetical protein
MKLVAIKAINLLLAIVNLSLVSYGESFLLPRVPLGLVQLMRNTTFASTTTEKFLPCVDCNF